VRELWQWERMLVNRVLAGGRFVDESHDLSPLEQSILDLHSAEDTKVNVLR
jgi:hypothetical protein